MPIALTEEMKQLLDSALVDRSPCLIASASAEGTPDVSYRGSMLVLDSEHLAFCERVKGETLSNLQENPRVCVFYRNAQTRQNWRFYGEAEVVHDEQLRTQIMERVNQFELAQDPERIGYAIRIRLDRVRERNETIMVRD